MTCEFDTISRLLHDTFACGGRIYLHQRPDGKFSAIHKRLGVAQLRKMLTRGESLAAFQFSGGYCQWICIDFDLHKDGLPANGETPDLTEVWEATVKCSHTLANLGVKHLVEYSGNRGFHIWVIFREKINRLDASKLLDHLLQASGLDGDILPVKIDRFPASARSSSDKGRAVKIPLSNHVKTKNYSYLIGEISSFSLGDSRKIPQLNPEFIETQIQLLSNDHSSLPSDLFATLGIELSKDSPEALIPDFVKVRITQKRESRPHLKEVLNSLRRCECIDGLLRNIERNEPPNEQTRILLVGLLVRIRSSVNPKLGIDYLNELFASLPEFDLSKTSEKVNTLSYLWPPTCHYIRSKFPDLFCACQAQAGVTSPVEYLEEIGFDISLRDPFSFEINETHNIRRAAGNYIRENDEVPILWVEREIQRLTDSQLSELCNFTDKDIRLDSSYYNFERLESIDGDTRKLVALSAKGKIWTLAATSILNSLISGGMSLNSYGYKLTSQFFGGRVFHNWLKQWKSFTSHIGELLYAPEYADWGLIKLDVKGFYDNIEVERLRVKLYDGPTPSLKKTYRSLPSESREKYRKIADKLIDLSIHITGSLKGVPQGPAFARFLAEVYLMDLDYFIESHKCVEPCHYARYVDDIFIFLPPEVDVAEFEGEVLLQLGGLGLRHNASKHYRGKVRDYQKYFAKYWQDTKYFIDRVSKSYNSVPLDEVRSAAKSLYDLIDSGNNDEINREHLNFFYTHLEKDPAMVALRSRIENHVLTIKEGRGSFFNNFYRYYIPEWAKRDFEFRAELADVEGLSRVCFLNMLLSYLAENPLDNPTLIQNIRKMVKALGRGVMSVLERDLFASLAMNKLEIAETEMIETISTSEIVEIVARDFPKVITGEVEKKVKDHLLRLDFVDYVDRLFDLIFTESVMSSKYLGSLLADFRFRIMEEINEARDRNKDVDILDSSFVDHSKERKDRCYQLCCLSSVSSPEPNEAGAAFDIIWGAFVESCNNSDGPPLITYRWVGKLGIIELSDVLVNLVITRGIHDVVTSIKDKHGVFREFHQQLALDQMGVSTEEHSGSSEGVEYDLKRAVKNDPDRWPLLTWVFGKSSPPDYYPNRDECLANVAINGVTVLRSENEFLVRRLASRLPNKDFDYLRDPTTIVDEFQGRRFVCETFKLSTEGYESVDYRLDSSIGLLGLFNTVSSLRNQAAIFGECYRPPATQFMPNYFLSNSRIRISDAFPEVPQLLLGERLIFASGKSIAQVDNCFEKFDDSLLAKLYKSGKSIFEDEFELANIHSGDVQQKLLGPFRGSTQRMLFISLFSKRIQELWASISGGRFGAHEVELCKAAAVADFMREEILENLSDAEYFFSRYLRLREEMKGHFEYQILLAPIKDAAATSVDTVYSSLKKSIDISLGSISPPLDGMNINGFLDRDIERLTDKIAGDPELDGLQVSMFVPGSVSIDQRRGGLFVNQIKILDADLDESESKKVSILDLTYLDATFSPLDEGHYQTLVNAGLRVYFAQWKEKYYMAIIPRSVYSAYEILVDRSVEYASLSSDGNADYSRVSLYHNRNDQIIAVRGILDFEMAAKVVLANHPDFTIDEAKLHLEQWLLRMPEIHRNLLTKVIAAHEVITEEHERSLFARLGNLNPSNILFSLTNANEVAGWHRMALRVDELNARPIIQRAAQMEEHLKIALDSGLPYEITIVSDLVLSGAQILSGLRHYLRSDQCVDSGPEKFYWRVDDVELMKRGFQQASKIRVLTARYAENCRERLLCSASGLPFITGVGNIEIEGDPISKDRCFLFGNALESVYQENFKNLLADLTFIENNFIMEGVNSLKYYKKSVSKRNIGGREKVDFTNLVCRRGSLPKRASYIFRMQLKSGYPSLFDYIK